MNSEINEKLMSAISFYITKKGDIMSPYDRKYGDKSQSPYQQVNLLN